MEQERKIREASVPSREEEIENLVNKAAECFGTICPSFVDFIRNIIEKGWVDFYGRPEKKLTTSSYKCFYIKSVHESRIMIQGMLGLLSFIDDFIIHEFAHAFGVHLSREDDIFDEGSAILQEVFLIYTEIVAERCYRRRRKEQNSPFWVDGLEEMYLKWSNTVFASADCIDREEKIYDMIGRKETLYEKEISELYGGHDLAFDCILVETEHFSVRHLIVDALALAFDKKVRDQGNVFLQEDLDLWRDVSKLTVEEFVKRLTGENGTKQMWAGMIEEFLLEPMRRYIAAMETL